MSDSLQHRLLARLEQDPHRPAVAFYSIPGQVSWRNVQDLYGNVGATARRLAEEGLRRGEVCIIVLPSGEAAAIATLAVLLLGALPLLIAPPILQGVHSTFLQTLRRTMLTTRASIVLCPESMRQLLQDLRGNRSRPRFLFGPITTGRDEVAILPRTFPDDSQVAALQLTSGTTGVPRICVWTHRAVLAALDGMAGAMALTDADVCFNWTPLYHDMGLVNNLLLCLTQGVPIALLSPQDFVKNPALWLRGLSETGATTTWSPNFGFAIATQRAKDEHLEGVSLHRVRAFWNAAERIHLETMQAFYNRFASYGLRREALKTNFGCAENVGGATFSDPEGPFVSEYVDPQALYSHGIARPLPGQIDGQRGVAVVGVGRPHPGLRVHILSKRARILPDGEVGEITLDTPSRMVGYLGDTRATRRALTNGLLRTGDLGYMRGGEVFWVGRVKERITVRGRKLDPSDFEPVLFEIPDLRPGCFAAFGIDDETSGTQRIVIVTEVRDPLSRPQQEITGDISRGVFLHLGLKLDDIVLVRPGTLTKTSSGKRRHRFFRRLYVEGGLAPLTVSGDATTGQASA
ncbi:MAG TPA: AMP-binding protein [bacterium]|jgi:acyl-CoA synthetase (AMP-forming)/AMP-acid ligase II|nr:AMP-binding protein [bacterium]